jgi:hypothetical protein
VTDFLIVQQTVTDTIVLKAQGFDTVTSSQQGPPGIQGNQGPQGVTGSIGPQGLPGSHFAHVQDIADSVWLITHGLGRIPSITVLDSAGDEVEGDYSYPDLNSVILVFSAPFGGSANFS